MNKIARLKGAIIHIDNLYNITYEKKELKCIECDSELIPKRGKKNSWHFAHKNKNKCYYNGTMKEGYKTPGGESAIHKLCKEIIENEKKILVPINKNNFKFMNFEKCIQEYEYDNKKIDIVGFTNSGKKIAIEIFYKHRVDNKKLNVLKKGFDYVIEICVEDDYFKTYKNLSTNIINGKENKRWLYLNKNTDIRIKNGYLELEYLKNKIKYEEEALKNKINRFIYQSKKNNDYFLNREREILNKEKEFLKRESKLQKKEKIIEDFLKNLPTIQQKIDFENNEWWNCDNEKI